MTRAKYRLMGLVRAMRQLLRGAPVDCVGVLATRIGAVPMYGVPADLDLTFLHDALLVQVCLGEYQIQFAFFPTGHISVEGKWELLAADGSRIDGLQPVPRTEPYRLHQLLGQRVVRTEIAPPSWIALQFERGELLRVFDNSQQYESFSIQPGNIFI
jgi:hypothetical protein